MVAAMSESGTWAYAGRHWRDFQKNNPAVRQSPSKNFHSFSKLLTVIPAFAGMTVVNGQGFERQDNFPDRHSGARERA